MFKGNMSKLLKQAKEMQNQIEEAKNQLSELIVEAESGGGMVSVKVNGKNEILELSIEEDAMKEEKEMLEDLSISAINKALSKAQSESNDKMNSITGGMMGGLNIPGM